MNAYLIRREYGVSARGPTMTLVAGCLVGAAMAAAPGDPARSVDAVPPEAGAPGTAPAGIGPPPLDYGDAPDGIPACGIGGPGIGFFPTILGTVNAAAGRDSPKHLMTAPGANIILGGAISYEGAAWQPPCDWFTFPCDDPFALVSDDSPLVLCLTPACTTGITVSGGLCGIGFGGCFGPSPGPAPLGYWIISSLRGPGAGGIPAFVNSVADFELSGAYGDAGAAWNIVDDPVPAAPGAYLHTGTPFPVLTIAKFPGGGWNAAPFWNRFMVSPEPLSTGPFPGGFWDGSGMPGAYPFGETEDWVVECDPAFRTCALPKYCFHSTGTIVMSTSIGDTTCQGPGSSVVNLNSFGLPSSMVREFRTGPYRDGGQIATELIQMELRGVAAGIGEVRVHERSDMMSVGLLRNIQAPGGPFLGADSFFDVFVKVDLPSLGMSLDTGRTPIRMNAGHINQLPPIGSTYNSGLSTQPTPLYIAGTLNQVGWICYAEHTPVQPVPWDCPGDANGDRVVNFGDVTSVLVNFGTGGPPGDANVDCTVNFGDVTSVLVNFGTVCPL